MCCIPKEFCGAGKVMKSGVVFPLEMRVESLSDWSNFRSVVEVVMYSPKSFASQGKVVKPGIVTLE